MLTAEDIIARIDVIEKAKHITDYTICKRTGRRQGTLSTTRKRKTMPSIPTLEDICEGLGVTLSDFFAMDTIPVYENQLNEDEAEVVKIMRSDAGRRAKALLKYTRYLLQIEIENN